ncbi:DUF3152 domain-containing protein [Streptomyces sp. GZWMJZ-114]|uniref:DUF3152 domain-containing protein n=1 Tax=Streptomyces sp. GZWMJZ-114 TaxID=2494734 RepID=UPI001010C93C|nr:DUF3152 domain-containing protein [Streptomyces sp. GZWMJZ-114]
MGRHRRPPNPQDRTPGAASAPPSPDAARARAREVPAQGAPGAAPRPQAAPAPRPQDAPAPRAQPPAPRAAAEGPEFRKPLPPARTPAPHVRGPHPEAAEPARPGVSEGLLGAAEREDAPDDGPRRDYLDAFDRPFGAPATPAAPARAEGARPGADDEDDVDLFTPRTRTPPPPGAATPDAEGAKAEDGDGGDGEGDGPARTAGAGRGGHKGRLLAGACAAALTLGLAVAVSGQHHDGATSLDAKTQAAPPSVDAKRSVPSERPSPSAPPTYDELMGRTYPLAADAKGPGTFTTVPGSARAPRQGAQLLSYRVDVEDGLKLDGQLFADAVQKTLNDDRSWAHQRQRAFQRISEGQPDFVVTLASPGTTADWCAKSGLDTTVDNVSCDSAATPRVMINAYRWAQGSTTYGDAIHPYRQMLINHEVGHRLGHNHVSCTQDGQLAPVMQQQTKFLDHDGITCLPNPWPYPKN